jgi:hypothetical protein
MRKISWQMTRYQRLHSHSEAEPTRYSKFQIQSTAVQDALTVSKHDTFSQSGVLSTSPNPQAGGPLLVGCPRLLIQYIPATLHIGPVLLAARSKS